MIGNKAFSSMMSTLDIKIGNGLKVIAESLFMNTRLSKVILGNSVKEIKDFAFYGTSLDEITLPKNVTLVYDNSFDKNTTIIRTSDTLHLVLTRNIIEYGEFSNKPYTSIIFNSDSLLKLITSESFYNTDLEEVVIPNSVVGIGEEAFSNCIDLKKVILGEKVQIIGKNAFANTPISDIIIPKSVKYINEGAFYNTHIESVNIPANIYCHPGAFSEHVKIIQIY